MSFRKKQMRFLLVRNDHIGDMICTTPAFQAIKKQFPKCSIEVVASSCNAPLIEGLSCVDKVHSYEKPSRKPWGISRLKAYWKKLCLFHKIFYRHYDVCIVFRGDYSPSANIFSRFSRARKRIGLGGPQKRGNYTHFISPPAQEHEILYCFTFLKPLGIVYQDEKPSMILDSLKAKRYHFLKGRILCHLSSRLEQNRINKEKWIEIIRGIGEKVVVTSTPEDVAMANEICQETGSTFIKTSSFSDLSCIVANVKLAVTLDGGVVHAAAALKVKVVVIAGKDNIKRWYPWGFKEYILRDSSSLAQNVKTDVILTNIEKALSDLKGQL
jgi:heptosyltransferase III